MARKEIPKHWKRNFNFGSIEAVETSDKKEDWLLGFMDLKLIH